MSLAPAIARPRLYIKTPYYEVIRETKLPDGEYKKELIDSYRSKDEAVKRAKRTKSKGGRIIISVTMR